MKKNNITHQNTLVILGYQDKKGFINIEGASIKVFNYNHEIMPTKVILLKFNGYLYLIDDSENNQEVSVFHDTDCEGCSDNPIKTM